MFKKRVAVALMVLTGCKILPNNMRSGTTGNEVGQMLDKTSLQFVRSADGKSGSLNFALKDQHNCRVEYWADDPSGTPPPSSPLSIDCQKDALKLTQQIEIAGLTAGFPLSFRIYVWPKTTTFLTHFSYDFHEGQDLNSASAQNLVVVRYASPRNSAEIYTYRMANALSLKDIKAKVAAGTDAACVENPPAAALPFPRNSSIDDAQKRPLLGLSAVTTNGFGSGAATQHPFFPTRLVEFYDSTERQENWKWSFQWEAQSFNFESFPPGYIGSLSIGDGTKTQVVKNRTLTGSLDTVDVASNNLSIAPKVLFPTDVSHFELTIKSADAGTTYFTCRFAVDKDNLAVPADLFAKLAKGNYLATFSFETSQVHYKDQASYPPWIITAQDWIQFRLNKRM